MIFKQLKSGLKVEDKDFDAIYQKRIRMLSKIHFTPVAVALAAAKFLVAKPKAKVLDIGSGAGKFCMVGASCTNGFFIGVEQRLYLYNISESLSKQHSLNNTHFIHGNIVEVELRQFDAIYFYNSFYENLFQVGSIDNTVDLDVELYDLYTSYLREQLETMPIGTRLATYFSFMDEVPSSYQIHSTEFDRKLKLWEKIA